MKNVTYTSLCLATMSGLTELHRTTRQNVAAFFFFDNIQKTKKMSVECSTAVFAAH